MIHEILTVGMLQCNCSIFGDETSREAMVIDPGGNIAQLTDRMLGPHDRGPLHVVALLASVGWAGTREEEGKAIAADPRLSLLFDGTQGLDQPLTGPRATLVGRAARRVLGARAVHEGVRQLRQVDPGHEVRHQGSVGLRKPGDRAR